MAQAASLHDSLHWRTQSDLLTTNGPTCRWLARYRELNHCCPQRARPRDHDALQHFASFLALHGGQQASGQADIESYLRTWFMGAPLADIRRGNVEELFAYGFFYDTRWALALPCCSGWLCAVCLQGL